MNIGQLKTSLENIMNGDGAGFIGFPKTIDEAAQNWTQAFADYYNSMSVPVPGSGNPMLPSGLQAFKGTIRAAMEARVFHIILEQAVTALHYQVIAGVQSYGIYETIPPPAPLKLQHCFVGNNRVPATTIAAMLASIIDPWAKSTISNQIIPPPAVIPYPWTMNQ